MASGREHGGTARRTLEKTIGKRQGQRTDKELPHDCAEVHPGSESRDITSERAGFENREEARRVRKVVDHESAFCAAASCVLDG
ncbi:MAG: hypothetical protein A2V70_06195 [Planctomycetes bacterium RBG_13_63_9]|nr:MAG: hypothetical protein A2V70_06195 [Planctomycetes bacterium RBG_13_63_9]